MKKRTLLSLILPAFLVPKVSAAKPAPADNIKFRPKDKAMWFAQACSAACHAERLAGARTDRGRAVSEWYLQHGLKDDLGTPTIEEVREALVFAVSLNRRVRLYYGCQPPDVARPLLRAKDILDRLRPDDAGTAARIAEVKENLVPKSGKA